MKKFILNLLIFIPFTTIIYICLLLLAGRFLHSKVSIPNLCLVRCGYGHMYTRLLELNSIDNIDILFVGSSHAYRGFDTRIFKQKGYKVFNLGSSAQTPIQSDILIKKYINKLNPKIVIYEVFPNSFSSDGVESSVDIISNGKIDNNIIKMALKINNIKTYNTLIYYIISDIIYKKQNIENKVKNIDKYIDGGFVEREVKYYRHISLNKKSIKYDKNQMESFNSIVNVIKSNKKKLILIYAPITPNNYNSYINNNSFDSTMNFYSEYYNFNKILNLDDSLYFYDPHHLNQKGVIEFNNKMLEVIDFKINKN